MALALNDNQPILHVRGGGERSVECGVWSVECGARREVSKYYGLDINCHLSYLAVS
jgi:hypothetical protein